MIYSFMQYPVICSIMLMIGLIIFYGIFRATRKRFGTFGACIATGISLVFAQEAYPTAEEKQAVDNITFLRTDPEIEFLIDTGSYVSNNIVHLSFTTRFLPSSAMLYLDYIPKTESADSTNYSTFMAGELSSIPNTCVFEFENAISNRWVFYTTYTQGANVHTNGVAVAEFMRARNYDNVAVPKRASIWEDGERVYPKNDIMSATADLLNQLDQEE